MISGISIKSVEQIPTTSRISLPLIVSFLHPEDAVDLYELLLPDSSSIEYSYITIKRKFPEIFEVLREANHTSRSSQHYGIWSDAVLHGYLYVGWHDALDNTTHIPRIEFLVSKTWAESSQSDVILEVGLQICRDLGFNTVQSCVNLKHGPAQHCFFRHGFRPLISDDPGSADWAIMVAPIKESRQELTFARYSRDVERMRVAMINKYGQIFPDNFIEDFAEFVNTYIVGVRV